MKPKCYKLSGFFNLNLLMVPGLTALGRLLFLRLPLTLIAIGFIVPLQAQLCTGSLGDPTVNITFGNGTGSYTAPGYRFTNSTCPDDGFYTITSSAYNCFNSSWYSIPADHTGNGGAFMLVNASFDPGDFFVTTVSDLCPNTTYEFAAWLMNVQQTTGINPNLTFKIETPGGTVLAEYKTGDITLKGQWKQYGVYFTTPPDNARVVLRMTNNAPGGYGNDIALDDITFRPCGPIITASINGYTDTVDVCEGNTDTYKFESDISSLYQSPAYQWQESKDSGTTWVDIPGAVTTDYLRFPTLAPGNYWYRLSVSDSRYGGIISCRISSNGVVINVHPKPFVDAGPDRIILLGNSNKLSGKAEGESITYTWTPPDYLSDNTVLTPAVSPPHDMIYKLSAVTSHGCEKSDNTKVNVVNGIYVPSAFTPNNDGKNDKWEIPFLDPTFEGEVSLFNRTGQLVYHSFATVVSWDGTVKGIPQASGVYVYMITSKLIKLNLKGTVALIR